MQTKVTPRQKMKRQVNFIFLANCISQTTDKEMWISVFMHWLIQGMGPGAPNPPPLPPYSPYFSDQTEAWRAEKIFFGDLPPSPPPRPPRYLKVWIRFYYVSFLLFTPTIKLRIKWRIMMSYVRLPIVWIVGALATVHQLCQRKLPKECQTKLLKKVGDLNLERY